MTGATGSLTPPGGDEAFVPAELREIADPAHHGDVTVTQRREGAARHAGVGEPGRGEPTRRPSDDAPRDSGYGDEPKTPRPHGADGDEWSEEPERF